MIQLRKIGEKNFRDILELCVRDDQKSFVAPNDISLIEAFAPVALTGVFPFAAKLTGVSLMANLFSRHDGSFTATFTNMEMTECQWKAHDGQQPDIE